MATYFEQVLGGTYDNHVLPFLWLKGEARETITEYLEQIAGADIREVCLESRTHPDFCHDDWWSDLWFIIDECKRLGLKIWLLDDAHFPTGYANGALEGEGVDPALKKTVLKHRTITVVGPQPSTTIKLGNLMDPTERFVGAAAFDAAGMPLDLALAVEHADDGTPTRLRFDAPAGITTIELYVTSQKTGFRDEYINMVDAASCRVLIDAVYEPAACTMRLARAGPPNCTAFGHVRQTAPKFATPIWALPRSSTAAALTSRSAIGAARTALCTLAT